MKVKEKKEIALEYALGGLENNVFASTYTYYIPDKERLISEVEKVLNDNKYHSTITFIQNLLHSFL